MALLAGADAVTGCRAISSSLRLHSTRAIMFYVFAALVGAVQTQASSAVYWKSVELSYLIVLGATVYRVTRYWDPQSRLRVYFALHKANLAILTFTLAAALASPGRGFTGKGSLPQIQGYIARINPNGLAFMALVAAIYLYGTSPKEYSVPRVGLWVIVISVFLSAQSRSSLLALACVVLVIAWNMLVAITSSGRRRELSRAATLLVVVVAVIASAIVFSSLSPGTAGRYVLRGEQSASDLADLSGRGYLWTLAAERIPENLWWGTGIGNASRTLTLGRSDAIGQRDQNGIGSVHNSVLEMLLGSGVVGTFFLMSFLLWSIWVAARRLLIPGTRTVASTGLGCVHLVPFALAPRIASSAELSVFSIGLLFFVLPDCLGLVTSVDKRGFVARLLGGRNAAQRPARQQEPGAGPDELQPVRA
jgi:O-antigen ligase